jgi:transcriptional regulator with GAF, ATPase, and Fis domain
MRRPDDSALLIVARGSTVNPNSSAPTLAHAAEREKKLIMQALAPTKGNVTAAAKKLRLLAGEPCIEDSTKMNLAKAADI